MQMNRMIFVMEIKNKILMGLLPFLVVSLLILAGCGFVKEKDPTLAVIGGTKITVKDFQKRISNLPERYRIAVMKRKKEYLQELINDTLLYQEAIRQGVGKEEEVIEVIEEAKKKILTAKLLKDKVDDKIVISETDMKEYYDVNSYRYMTPEILRASHILSLNRDDAEAIKLELENGADFADMAKAKSVDPTAQRAGDIGYFPRGQLMPEFENACAVLEIGEVSDIVKTKLGYHIIKLTGRKEPEMRPMEQVQKDILSRLKTVKRQKMFNELLSDLRNGTDIKINEEEFVKGEFLATKSE